MCVCVCVCVLGRLTLRPDLIPPQAPNTGHGRRFPFVLKRGLTVESADTIILWVVSYLAQRKNGGGRGENTELKKIIEGALGRAIMAELSSGRLSLRANNGRLPFNKRCRSAGAGLILLAAVGFSFG
jgi:hypothetical protein